MSVNDSVNRIVTGSGVIFAGTLIGLLFDITIKRVLTSYLSPAVFGTYTLALTVISITGAIATLGLNEGVPRYIAYFRGRNEDYKIHELIISAAAMGLIAAVLAMLASPALFERLAGEGFDIQGKILSVVKIMIFALPFTILLNVAVAIYRGFDRTNVNMYFYNIIRPLSLLVFASTAIFFGASFHGIVLVDLLSMIFTFGVMSVYFMKRPPIKLKLKLKFSEPTKQLIRYSFPLLITATLLNLMTWTDTIMLGYFKSAEVVGVYSAVYPLVGFLSMIIGSMGFVYIPVISKLWGENSTELIGSIYQITTKWCFLLTFPIFALMFVYPESLLTRIYGTEYASGATVLRILALGFITNSYFGFNYHTIMASGDSDFLMKCSLTSAGMNVLLNFILVPQYGMVGAAIASSVSFASIEVFMTLKTWKKQNMHPFTSTYRKLTFIGIFMVVSMLAARKALLLTGASWEYAAFIILYYAIVEHAKILDENEMNIIGKIRKDIRYNISIRIPHIFKINA
jgi:O-antigen/teichoic acid export membrane protein